MSRIESAYFCDLSHTGQGVSSDTMPYRSGCLAAYLKTNFSADLYCGIYKFVDDFDAGFRERTPDVVCFSNFVWNEQLNLRLAQCVKEYSRDIVVIFGGPQFPRMDDGQRAFLRDNPQIDFFIEKEGERAMLGLFNALREHPGDLDAVKSLRLPSVRSYCNGEFMGSGYALKILDLSEVVSPYTTGLMAPFFRQNLMPVLQTSRGCPFTCTYCVEGDPYHSTIGKHPDATRFSQEINYIAREVEACGGNTLLNLADSNFGMYPEDISYARCMGKSINQYGFPSYIHVATGKNNKQRVNDVVRLVNGRMRVSASVQSLDKEVLDNIKRSNIDTEELAVLGREAINRGGDCFSEIILALPGDTKEKHFSGVKRLIDSGFNHIALYTLMILSGSLMDDREHQEKYGMDIRYRVLPRCFGKYEFLGNSIGCAEYEAVCVAQDSLSFEDYMECRCFALTVFAFYNDKAFGYLQNILEYYGAPISEWISRIHDLCMAPDSRLRNIYTHFARETENELFTSPSDILRFVDSPGTIEKYMNGEFGYNLLYTFKYKIIVQAFQEACDIAINAFTSLLGEQGIFDPTGSSRYVEELGRYISSKCRDMFDAKDIRDVQFSYDFLGREQSGDWALVNDEQTAGTVYDFIYPEETSRNLATLSKLFGTDEQGQARIFTRIPIQSLYRVPVSVVKD